MNNYGHYLLFLFISLVVSIGTQVFLPFPYGLGLALAIFIIFPLAYRRVVVSKMGGAGRFGGMEGSKFAKLCVICGKKTDNRECPRCGSKQFKIG